MTVVRAPLRPVLVVSVAAIAVTLVLIRSEPARSTTTAQPRVPDASRGRELFLTGCSSCHGVNGKGQNGPGDRARGPSLEQAGAAAAYFYLSTGRMPLGSSNAVPVRKPRAYSPRDIDDLVAFVATLGTGPPVPSVHPSRGNLADGGELFRANCAACHSATGAGGALSYGQAAPTLTKATPTELASAMAVGPGQMPRFASVSKRDVDSIARYVEYLHNPDDRGGVALGRLGPIPEGFLIWVVGVGGLLVAAGWIGARRGGRGSG